MAKLYFYYSTMNAGKTTALLQSAHNYRERGLKPLLFTPAMDDRHKVGVIKSRIGLEADAIRGLAREESAGTVILAEVSKPSNGAIAIEVDLRSGHSGASLYRYRTDVARGRDLNIALTPNLERIAGEIVRDLGYRSHAENARSVDTAIVVAVAPDVAPVSPTSPKDDALPEVGAAALPAEEEESAFNFFSSDEPLEITSNELEVITQEDSKLIIFRENVHAVQGDVTMVSDYLEAFYPSGASDPDRLNARGRVKVIDLEREIRCREASYLRATEIITCIGDAIMIQGCDEVRGAKIVFNLNDERVTVFGGVSMTLRPEDEAAAAECDLEGTG